MDRSRRSTNAKRAAYELRQQIVNGKLTGGTRLYEVALADELQISRTPVREAMVRLAEEGLLERGEGGGYSVRSFTIADVFDAIELRGVLEGTAARMAAERGVPADQLANINAIVEEIDKNAVGENTNLDRYGELNAAFHDALASLCGSALIERELVRAKSLPFASPSAFVLGAADSEAAGKALVLAQVQHRAIISAIEAGEGTRAEFLAREHARTARANLEAFGTDPDSKNMTPALALIVN